MSSKKEKIKIAIIGCGRFARFFVPLFKAHPSVEKVYVCDLIKERAEKYSEEFDVEIIESFEEAFAIFRGRVGFRHESSCFPRIGQGRDDVYRHFRDRHHADRYVHRPEDAEAES